MKYLLIILILTSSHAFSYSTKADYAYLIDTESQTILYAKNHKDQMKPSSMSKLMTIYILFDYVKKGIINLDDSFLASEKAWRTGGSKMFVGYKKKIKIEDLIKGIIVQSGNDACIVVAEGISSTTDDFVRLMNEYSKKLGLKNSQFMNPTGLPDEGHYMSAEDVAKLAYRIIKDFPNLYDYFKLQEFTYNGIKQANRNKLLSLSYLNVDGLKTGHTEEAGYGIVNSAVKNKRRLISVVNGLDSDLDRQIAAERILNYGFKYFRNKTIFYKDNVVGYAEVFMGTKNKVALKTNQNVIVSIPKFSKSESNIKIEYLGPIKAPIKKDTKIAYLVINIEGNKISHPLYAVESVEKTGFAGKVLKTIKYYFN